MLKTGPLATTWGPVRRWHGKRRAAGAGCVEPHYLGDKVFVTCYSGYGLDESEPGDIEKLVQHVLCVDAASGKTLWAKAEKGGSRKPNTTASSPCTATPAATPTTDGKMLYVFFGHSGVFAYSLDGEQLWHASVGDRLDGWGSAASPILYKNLLIVNASVESGSLVALDKTTGKRWAERRHCEELEPRRCWCRPAKRKNWS